MEKEIPLFPLNLVVFPGEYLNLHIFEPRYKALINDCLKTKTTFGIPSYVLNKIEYGGEVKITEVSKIYPDGRMDIKTECVSIFKIHDYWNPWNQHLYAGGLVELLAFGFNRNEKLHFKIVDTLQELFKWLQMEEEIEVHYDMNIYEVIHKIGLKPEEEYALLKMDSEPLRQEYILNHLNNLLPMLQRAEEAKAKIRMNGHFKHLDPLKF